MASTPGRSPNHLRRLQSQSALLEAHERGERTSVGVRALAIGIWLVAAFTVASVRSAELGIVAAAAFLPFLVATLTQPRGLRGVAAYHPILDVFAAAMVGFFAWAVLADGSSEWACAGVGIVLGAVVLTAKAARRGAAR